MPLLLVVVQKIFEEFLEIIYVKHITYQALNLKIVRVRVRVRVTFIPNL